MDNAVHAAHNMLTYTSALTCTSIAALQPCSLAALQPCSLAALQPCSLAALQPNQQSCSLNPTALQACSHASQSALQPVSSLAAPRSAASANTGLPSSPSPTAVRFQQPTSFCAVLAVAALEERSVLANTKVRNCNQDISESLQDLQLCSVIDLIVQHMQLCQY